MTCSVIQLQKWRMPMYSAVALILSGCNGRSPSPDPPLRDSTETEKPLVQTEDSSSKATSPIRLENMTEASGITFIHTDGSNGTHYIVETVTGGLALFDYDGDDDVDIYFLNGSPLRGIEVRGFPPSNALYRNEGNWRFTDVSDQAGIGDTGFGLGVTVGDFDNDGHADLYVNNYGPNVLYRNNGDGTFADVTIAAGVDDGQKVGAGACFLDMDADGDLDLYSASYLKFSYERHEYRTVKGHPTYQAPLEFPAEPDSLFRNDGDGTFTDVSKESGVGARRGTGMGMVCADYDRDGDTDAFVLNDVAGNFLYQNDGKGKFTEVAVDAGLAVNIHGTPLGSMGVDCGDYDNDGWPDFFMTSYQLEFPVLYRNLGGGSFEDVTVLSGTGASLFPHVNWGPGFVDFDNDADQDIFVAQGHLEDNIDLYDDTTAYRVRNTVLMNTGKGNFMDVSDSCGNGLLPAFSSRGAAFDDLDNDGDIDAVVLNSREAPTVVRNATENSNHWIQIRLRGAVSNRDAVGAYVKVVAGDLPQVAEVHSGRGYQSHWGSRLHFGLGARNRIDRIEVRWIGGGVDVFEGIAADQLLSIAEGSGQASNE